jgi:alkanesulfonate monooxygenase
MSNPSEFLWYIPNQVEGGHRGDTSDGDPSSLETLTSHATALEEHGWTGALIGTSWGRPDTFTVATALTARTKTFEPLIAIRPGYWRPANFAAAAATLDELTGGRVRINIVSGQDNLAAYGDSEGDQAHRYGRTKDFMRLVRRLWTETNVTFESEHFRVTGSTVAPRITPRGGRLHPRLYFGGASEAAERVAATDADVQLFWGEPLDGVADRIARLKRLSRDLDRDLPPLEFGLRITTLVRDTSEEAWADAEAKVLEKRYVDAGAPPLKAFVERSGMTMNVGGVQEQRVQPVRPTLLMLQGGVAFVLLIGCVNVANLLLVRSNARQSELAEHLLGLGLRLGP